MLPILIDYLKRAGWTYKACLVWVKNQFVIGAGDYHWQHESILYAWKEDGAHYFTDDRTQASIFEVDNRTSALASDNQAGRARRADDRQQ